MAFADLNFYGLLWRNQGLRWLFKVPEAPKLPSVEVEKVEVPETVPPQPLFTLPEYLPPERWPQPWQKLLQKTKPYQIVWTYEQLGYDLLGVPSTGLNERYKFLTQLLKDIGHKGTNTFWPLTLPKIEPDPRIFWSGIQHLQARYVIFLGDTAVCQSGLPRQIKFGDIQIFEKYVVYVYMSMEELNAHNAQYKILINNVKKLITILKREHHV